MHTDTLLPLLRHMEWADSLMWRAVLALPEQAQADPFLRQRLLHVHLVQRAFLAMWRGAPMTSFPSPSDFPDLAALAAFGRSYYAEVHAFIASAGDAVLSRPQPVPHSEQLTPPGGSITVATMGETVMHVTMHTTYHRGQLATQVRALGGEPPLTDLVAWIWLGRPSPVWSELHTVPSLAGVGEPVRQGAG